MTRVTGRQAIQRLLRGLRRRWARSAASYRYGVAERAVVGAVSKRKPVVRLLLVSDGAEYTSEQQFAPLIRHQRALRRELGIVFRMISQEAALARPGAFFLDYDVVGLKLSFRSKPGDVEKALAHLRKVVDRTTTKLVYFDGDDDQSMQWPNVCEAVDLYVKKHGFADISAYRKAYRATANETKINNLTDYVARLAGDDVPDQTVTSVPVGDECLGKLHVGWNIALDDKIEQLVARPGEAGAQVRSIDILCRAHVPPEAWIAPMRSSAIEAVTRLSSRFNVLAPRSRVSQEEYNLELTRSRICVSPIGYGELCWRDFEAILSGCLLVKPSMDHITTKPNIFVPHSTYIPVNWDYSDLEEKCAFYLENEAERAALASRARSTLLNGLTEEWFLREFSELMARLIPSETSAVRREKAPASAGLSVTFPPAAG
ncbi:glycosyltransferase [Aminobacter aganoensis]|uniref:Spore protein YkvP/CgeB glycosyl transferase-like domain-containing protein n=1 Tax=Aminobacter aganoensis TaxID=83264 RepID=A0A7X0FB75_9HYPH|nr:glycosyltransferase [Aminobacter aganoensis]MBB6356511.1 hypothetical protein [Aminobacter aganoensis]